MIRVLIHIVRLISLTTCALVPAACVHSVPEPSNPPARKAQNPSVAVDDSEDETVWINALDLGLDGQGWSDTARPYDRLPARAEELVREPVWSLSRCSSGLCVRFVSDSPQIQARWTLRSRNLAMNHMPATGVSGLDLYARSGDSWRWVGIGRATEAPTNRRTLIGETPPDPQEYLLYLPLYNGIESLEIGIEPGATIAPLPPWPEERRPLCFYGTSITQGGCASRPGMAYPAILGRHLNRPSINLGFSGNGRMDLELADLMAEIDAAIYVLDCGPNMTQEWIEERTVPFIQALHRARPDTPILLIEDIVCQDFWFSAGPRETHEAKNASIHEAYETLLASGVTNLHLLDSADLLGHDGEASVDGVHFTDLGFVRMSEALEPTLRSLIGP